MYQHLVLPLAFLTAACPGSSMDGLDPDPVTDPATNPPTNPAPGGTGLPSQALIEEAKARLGVTMTGTDLARVALEQLGFLPTYDCGAPRGEFVPDVLDALAVEYACATVSVDSSDPAVDAITVTFDEAGCEVAGRNLSGALVVRLAGGQDRFDLEVDARALAVDGALVQALAGYGTCSDETRYWVLAEGDVPGHAGKTFYIDASVAKRDGLPVIGGTTLMLSGTGELTEAGATDRVTMESVEYELGDLLPKNGTIILETASGRRIRATFTQESPLYRKVSIQIDAYDAVTVVIPG